MKRLSVSLLAMSLLPVTGAMAESSEDFMRFAQEWTAQEAQKKRAPVPKDAPPPRKPAAGSVTPAAVKPGQPVSPPQENRQHDTAPEKPQHNRAVAPVSPATKLTAPAPIPADPVRAGQWLKKMWMNMTLSPDEQAVRGRLASLQQERDKLAGELDRHKAEDIRRQDALQLLQRRLKQLQSPPLPEDAPGLESFSAGMAAGINLRELLDAHAELGVVTDRKHFIAGVREAIQEDQRLSEEDFHHWLRAANERLAAAEARQREAHAKEDAAWLKTFRQEPGVRQTAPGVWSAVHHAGGPAWQPDEPLQVAISRRTTWGEIKEDSDISGVVLEGLSDTLPEWMQPSLRMMGYHGQARIGLRVNEAGIPDVNGPRVEVWDIRLARAEKRSEEDEERRGTGPAGDAAETGEPDLT
ncbi:hypothetical protein F3J31_21740 [Enterobacter sp. Acro-832]|uniref:FKBP-type peptidyl-prolyl cis-trans isomerase N-terminal domain-containing protein n=1 Tax=Enterobacter sp. Acro-832 TaxID=2608348 RepID=UPI00141FE0A2|nr:FKBP-type peptidyl-prolyl cis-trans isomerase N-terminal domain-containing protein [Enterobacter sp. Acro-832]NIG46421.1 hypothetical protein [Enterobacter sp. Acro-832]